VAMLAKCRTVAMTQNAHVERTSIVIGGRIGRIDDS
jgi:hypothetical protein